MVSATLHVYVSTPSTIEPHGLRVVFHAGDGDKLTFIPREWAEIFAAIRILVPDYVYVSDWTETGH